MIANTDNRRKSSRMPLEIWVSESDLLHSFVGFGRDISVGGMFVKSPAPLEEGTRCRVTFVLGGRQGKELACNADVLPSVTREPGFRLRFDGQPSRLSMTLAPVMERLNSVTKSEVSRSDLEIVIEIIEPPQKR